MKKTAAKSDMPKVPRDACTKDNSVLETELKLAAEHGVIADLTIHETEQGYYLTATFNEPRNRSTSPSWNASLDHFVGDRHKIWYLTSRHHRTSPRLHKSLGRLNELMREKFPTDSVILMRDQYLPGIPRLRGRPMKRDD